jgi:hypothetical protein
MAENIQCKTFTDYLIRKAEHLDDILLKDVTPTDGWVGHVSTGVFPAYDGVEHTFDRINRVFPDLSGCWTDVTAGSCIGTPCDPTEKKIGFGSTRDSYKLQTASYGSDLFCFDQILSADRAKEQFAAFVTQLKDATNIINSERLRTEAIRIAGKKIVSSATTPDLPLTWTTNATCTQITVSRLPTSRLNMKTLQRQIVPLMLNGYLGAVPGMPPMFELVTDIITAHSLREGNAELAAMVQFKDFVSGGALYKYGITDAIGNFGIRLDLFPVRYQLVGGLVLERVYPYKNVAATQGIKGVVNDEYVNAPYQFDVIWNRMAMKSLGRDASPLNPMMPFLNRSYAGKWQFAMDNLGADASGCVINNERRNKGKFIADFSYATKAERPEWAVAILSLTEPAFVTNIAVLGGTPAYVAQNYSSANAVCAQVPLTFTLAVTTDIDLAANSVKCNGVPLTHAASVDHASVAAFVTALNALFPNMGTWSTTGGANLTLTGSTCTTVELTVT